jgi:hypothetical protein
MREMNRDELEDYVPVAERVIEFYSKYPEGRLIHTVIEHNLKKGFILMKCEAYRNLTDEKPASSGHASEFQSDGEVNAFCYIENCETSADGRALAFLGFGVSRHVASREEMLKAARHRAGDRGQGSGVSPIPNRQSPTATAEWDTGKNGKLLLVLDGNDPEPPEIACPIHQGKTLRRKEGQYGSFLSHPDGEDRSGKAIYCNADFRRKPRPDAASADLKTRLAEANNRNGARAQAQV